MFIKLQEYPLFYILWVFANLLIWQELGAAGLGKFFFLISVVTFLAFTLSFGLDRSLNIISRKHPNNRPELIGNSLFSTLLWSGSIFFVIYFAIFFNKVELFFFIEKDILLISTLSILPICLSIYSIGILSGVNKLRFINLILTVKGVMVVIGLIYALKNSVLTLELALSIWVVSEFIITLILINRLLAHTNYNFKIRLINLPRYLKGSILTFLLDLAFMLLKHIDIILLSLFVGFGEIGQYVIALLVIGIVWRIPALWTDKFLNSSDISIDVAIIAKVLRIAFTVSLLTAFLFLIVGWFFSVLIYGSKFDIVYLLYLQLIPGGVLLSQSRILLHERVVRSAINGSIFITSLSSIMIVGASIILIPQLGAAGAAFAFSISQLFLGAILLFRYQKRTGSNWSDLFILKQGDIDISKTSLISNS